MRSKGVRVRTPAEFFDFSQSHNSEIKKVPCETFLILSKLTRVSSVCNLRLRRFGIRKFCGCRIYTKRKEKKKMEKETIMNNIDIQKILPHRYPFLLVDKITEFEECKSITGIKNVTAN